MLEAWIVEALITAGNKVNCSTTVSCMPCTGEKDSWGFARWALSKEAALYKFMEGPKWSKTYESLSAQDVAYCSMTSNKTVHKLCCFPLLCHCFFSFLIFSPHFSMSSGSCCETSKSERVPIKGSQLRSANCSNLAMENPRRNATKTQRNVKQKMTLGHPNCLHSFHDMESKVVNLRRHQTMAWAIRHWLSRHGPSVFCCRTYDLHLATSTISWIPNDIR